ncbi:hypothetical protein [uncultured Gammaproteobacteria bacterium]|uniref:hypothetical protein n=1 Tax=Bathymodiolus heckerae thiotrophic gill symbiont TaxID=1052212 RepID=UPI0010B691D5|nr:hypothetical protein [Bathymodiolus heckerae thiotrophic gill symbiont]CAC9582339.1 hypothetical protein [uncultured Gammaproteobacteria bacterium]CAC9586874.1 hypothetical protein [uncultured Gammaproteobacteria bacterium]CAC9608202.1 hypothetical protein [uncultured Gammaproteobacteria bacterium]CAC9957898.1 hypothetical protein [uncultured Gammaproteobacteria bacterium]SHN89984.1 hypothetical protein BHECKSOX_154 [Bathymodiolus heckerae thiotrophic gill symbiont]
MNKFILAIFLVVSISSSANFESVWEKSVGWTIESTKIIDSFEHENGRVESAFQGCEVGRNINFRDDTYVTCNTKGYQYAHAPTAILLSKNVSYGNKSSKIWRMIVNNEIYGIE